MPIRPLQLLYRCHPLRRQLRVARRRHVVGEEPRLPLDSLGLALRRLLSLSLFNVLLGVGRRRELLRQDRLGDGAPEPATFVRQLLVFWWNDFGQWPQRREIYDEVLLLCILCQRKAFNVA